MDIPPEKRSEAGVLVKIAILGASDGEDVGDAVGADVGVGVADAVGVAVGDAVGEFVGVVVGVARHVSVSTNCDGVTMPESVSTLVVN